MSPNYGGILTISINAQREYAALRWPSPSWLSFFSLTTSGFS
jgi:hypothetical protein